VSSELQAETLAHQRKMAQDDAKLHGWRLDRVGDNQGGDPQARSRSVLFELIPELRRLESDERPAWIWMRRVDRMGRGRIAESQLAMDEIVDLGVRLWDHDAGEVRLETATDQIIAAVKSGLAKLENEVRRDKMLAVYARKRAAGQTIGNKRPYGITRGPDGREVAVEPEAAAVRIAFRMTAAGASNAEVARKLSAIAPPRKNSDGRERGQKEDWRHGGWRPGSAG
jgi:DNA invertase Pin-like site-specific DNA recombinase